MKSTEERASLTVAVHYNSREREGEGPCVISANFLGIISVAWHARLERSRKSGDPRRQNYFLPKKKKKKKKRRSVGGDGIWA